MTTEMYVTALQSAINSIDGATIEKVANVLKFCSGNIFVFGNGGSGATASHFAQDMNKNTTKRFICLNDNMATILAYSNDCGFSCIFEKQLAKLIQKGDIVIGISGSGNSVNVIKAVLFGNGMGCTSIALVGFDGGKLKKVVDYAVHVPSDDMQICEDIHLVVTHIISRMLC